MNKEIKRCKNIRVKNAKKYKKLYPDWEDNEYNCADNKFIFAVVSPTETMQPSFYSLNDLLVYYNRGSKQYFLDIETSYDLIREFEKEYLKNLLNKFKLFVKTQPGEYTPKLSDININDGYKIFQAESLQELLFKFNMFVKSF